MSDGSLELKENQPQISSPDEKKDPVRKAGPAPINTELKNALSLALNSWENLSRDVESQKSPDVKQLEEVKKLLGEIKNKLNEFID